MNVERLGHGPPRVLHLIESQGLYGAENVVINLSREMKRMGTFHPVVGCVSQGSDGSLGLMAAASEFGIEAHTLTLRNALLLFDFPKLLSSVRKLEIDVIHCHGYKADVFGCLVGQLMRVPVVSTCHLWFLSPKAPLKMRFMVGMARLTYRYQSYVVAVSNSIMGNLLKAGVPAQRVRLIRNGVPVEDYSGLSEDRLDEGQVVLGSQTRTFRVLNVARLAPQKAQNDLVAAATRLRDEIPGVQVLIVGEGELRSLLQQEVRRFGLSDTVKLLGFRSDIRELLATADVFVLPSLDEGMPISLLEAVASRVPVVATGVGDIPSLIFHDRSGLIVSQNDPDDVASAIIRLHADPQHAARLAESAFEELIAQYSSSQMCSQYSAVYASVV